jgi:hypothetical protein
MVRREGIFRTEEIEMRIRPVAALLRQSIVSSVVLTGVTSLTLLSSAGSVSAKDNMSACAAKHSMCFQRCSMNNPGNGGDPDSKAGACVERTCDHQYKTCSGQSGPPDYSNMDPPKGTRPIVDRSPSGPRPGGSGGVGGGRPGGGVSVGGRPGREAGNVRDHRGGGGRGRIIYRVKTPSTAGEVQLPSGGILDTVGGGFGQQGPASTGSPVMSGGSRTPSGPVIIR